MTSLTEDALNCPSIYLEWINKPVVNKRPEIKNTSKMRFNYDTISSSIHINKHETFK